ncbi:hypothetical protein GYMLUDRAFT_246950 [Collybiopsis luxurians FD-317 M1]|uniref:Uncharacterized protein n=1 Tax=Collybiopsis luxurians FD-317 M1 TaxID=944289 RepID=A0A0D0C578_9AGAR|nr:hypothetical protein GYMLUDRAFT_246950 [Collybiopsis luxurians FD-317 M1]
MPKIPKPFVRCFGHGKHIQPLFPDLAWKVKEGESWAVAGSGGGGEKAIVFNTLFGHYRISPHPPPPGGLFPFLHLTGPDPYSEVSIRGTALFKKPNLPSDKPCSQNPETIPPLQMPYEDPAKDSDPEPII